MKSTDILNECISVQSARAKEYEATGEAERSFDFLARIVSVKLGKELTGSDMALILEELKYVRAVTAPKPHKDSYVDKTSYSSLWAELHYNEKLNQQTNSEPNGKYTKYIK